jgi:Cell division protein
MRRVIPALFALLSFPCSARAQVTPTSRAFTRAIAGAMQLANDGRLSEARAAIDSLLRVIPADSPELADAIFARATAAQSALDANLDYGRIIREFPTSERRQESLLRVAQRSLVAGDDARALDFLLTMKRDYRADSSQAISNYWLGRVLLEERDVSAACTASREAAAHANSTEAPLRSEILAQVATSCGIPVTLPTTGSGADRLPHPAIPIDSPTGAGTAGQRTIYAIQVSAYAKRADADGLAGRLKKTGLDAHVDGDVKPFRVRIGHYYTYAEAAAALRELKTRKLTGFVAEMNP